MRNIPKTCLHCGSAFAASSGSEKFCTNKCMFSASVEKSAGCWTWRGVVDREGYGVMRLKGRSRAKAHRFSYELAHGPIPAGAMVRHFCDNPSCVNPEHLLIGSAKDNKRDCMERGRHLRGERHHKAKLTADDVRAIRLSGERGAQIAARYGVTKENVYAIQKRKIWKDI